MSENLQLPADFNETLRRTVVHGEREDDVEHISVSLPESAAQNVEVRLGELAALDTGELRKRLVKGKRAA